MNSNTINTTDTDLQFGSIMEMYENGNKETAVKMALEELSELIGDVIKTYFADYSRRYKEDLWNVGRSSVITGIKTFHPEENVMDHFRQCIKDEIAHFIEEVIFK